MKIQRFHKLIGVLILGHLTISLMIILYPPFLSSNPITRIYKRYLLPGPFFSDDRINQTHFLQVSWKKEGRWSTPIDPAFENFKGFLVTGNPKQLYFSRLDRTFYQDFIISMDSTLNSRNGEKWDVLSRYYRERYIPREADSTRLIFIRKESKDFKTHVDTVYKVIF